MKDSEVLRKARKHIVRVGAKDLYYGLCLAIEDVYDVDWSSEEASQSGSLIRWVQSMLYIDRLNHRPAFLTGWLIENGHLCPNAVNQAKLQPRTRAAKELRTKMLSTRLAWIGWVIAEGEKAEAKK